MKHKKRKFRSLARAVKRIQQLEKLLEICEKYRQQSDNKLVVLAKLSADTPRFYNPLEVWRAKEIRDKILINSRT